MSQTTIIRFLAIALVALALIAAYGLGAASRKPAASTAEPFNPCNVSSAAQVNCAMYGTPSGH